MNSFHSSLWFLTLTTLFLPFTYMYILLSCVGIHFANFTTITTRKYRMFCRSTSFSEIKHILYVRPRKGNVGGGGGEQMGGRLREGVREGVRGHAGGALRGTNVYMGRELLQHDHCAIP
ncbi:hypothetical protein Pcinc_020514 [Petrolisthes cinctipes]|uniref:Uncharacterized protein n=1 Tax=Petrolisthes cinctipes TaxID=88211 RepID=A0AAE1KLA5_PETCI|nr:hypothetical protein Pcinc_020514 [Petrolisthes cinctipes]